MTALTPETKRETIKVLVVDDELPIRKMIKASLVAPDYQVTEASTGQQAIQAIARLSPDVVLLDLGLPDIDGTEVVRQVREWSTIPIIVISARWQEDQKVLLLEAGVDDYMTKPFSIGELIARIRVAIRHHRASKRLQKQEVFENGPLKIDMGARQVWLGGKEVHLTPLEYKLLMTLVQHAGKVVTHRKLLVDVWGPEYSEETQYVRVYMGYLRKKIEEDPMSPTILLTEPRVGYRLALDESFA